MKCVSIINTGPLRDGRSCGAYCISACSCATGQLGADHLEPLSGELVTVVDEEHAAVDLYAGADAQV